MHQEESLHATCQLRAKIYKALQSRIAWPYLHGRSKPQDFSCGAPCAFPLAGIRVLFSLQAFVTKIAFPTAASLSGQVRPSVGTEHD